jgi:DnaJ-class molecular chaperone
LAESQRPAPTPISDEDVLDFLSDSDGVDAGKSNPGQSSGELKAHKAALKRHKKICPACHGETSFAFDYCPRCGGPLEIAVIEM